MDLKNYLTLSHFTLNTNHLVLYYSTFTINKPKFDRKINYIPKTDTLHFFSCLYLRTFEFCSHSPTIYSRKEKIPNFKHEILLDAQKCVSFEFSWGQRIAGSFANSKKVQVVFLQPRFCWVYFCTLGILEILIVWNRIE